MPRIIGQAEQQAAFKEIGGLLKTLEKTNQFLNTPNKSGRYTISFPTANGGRCSAPAFSPDKSAVDELILNNKLSIRQHIEDLAREHRIGLDIEDKMILGIELTPQEMEDLEARRQSAPESMAEHSSSSD